MTNTKLTAATVEAVNLMTPFNSEERKRIIAAALTLLGDEPMQSGAKNGSAPPRSEDDDQVNGTLPPKAKTWAKQHGVTPEELAEVFHIKDGSAEIIATVAGKNGKEKTLNAYLMTGIAKLLATGSATFDDKEARAYCKSTGCYDNANHATYMKNMGNGITGSKEKGWELTMPGQKLGALLVKAMASGKP